MRISLIDPKTKFYIVSGKGGVGKTSVSVALALMLKESGKEVVHVSFKTGALKDDSYASQDGEKECQELGVTHLSLDLEECSTTYMAKKLKSTMIAHWIAKTPFFRSLVNMIPGFNYLIYLGKILEIIHASNYETVVVLDAPSSGHALTMLEATKNFQQIFKSGLVFEDTNQMLALLHQEQFLNFVIVTIATELALQESIELKQGVEALGPYKVSLVTNNGLSYLSQEAYHAAPQFIQQKIDMEKRISQRFVHESLTAVHYSYQTSSTQLIKDIKLSLQSSSDL
jgi:arsenite-transporting ATPase